MHIRWTLRKKILIGYGINLVLMLIGLLWAMGNLLMFESTSDVVTGSNYRSILASEILLDTVERQNSAILLYLLGYETKGLEEFRNAESGFLQWLGRVKDSINLEGESGLIETIEAKYTEFLGTFTSLQEMRMNGEYVAGDYFMRTILPLQNSIRNDCMALRELNQTALYSESSRSRFILNKAVISTAMIGIVLIIIGLSFSFFLSNILVEPLQDLVSATRAVSQGNYQVMVRNRSSDELGTLASEFNTMVGQLREYNDMNIEQIVSEKHKNDAILRSIEDGIIVISSDYRIININLTAASILKVDADLVRGRHLLEVIGNRELFERIRNSMETGAAFDFTEGKNILTVQNEGTHRHYLFSIASVHSRTESMVGVVLLFKDITKLKELDDLKNEFVMTASHELRTPLTSIEMGVKLVQERMDPFLAESDREVLTAVQEEVQRLKDLVNDLLDLSRIEAGKLELRPEPVDLASLSARVVDGLKTQAAARKIKLKNFIKPGLVPEVLADPERIAWVLVNLLGNALRYTPDGGKINVRAEEAGTFVQVSVSDTGSGIPYEYQSKIFEKFVQVRNGKENQGTGLGLSICKELVHAHGGAIWVESVPGEGSTFIFTLPVA